MSVQFLRSLIVMQQEKIYQLTWRLPFQSSIKKTHPTAVFLHMRVTEKAVQLLF